MNKQGLLLKKTLELVLAAIGILFLAAFLVAIYFSVNNSQELEQAKSSLNFLMSEINSGKTNVALYNPEGWWIVAWPHEFKTTDTWSPGTIENRLPESCSNLGWTSCICICEEDNAYTCDNDGVCLNNPSGFQTIGEKSLQPGGNEVFQEGGIQIKNPPIILIIDRSNKDISKKAAKPESQEIGSSGFADEGSGEGTGGSGAGGGGF